NTMNTFSEATTGLSIPRLRSLKRSCSTGDWCLSWNATVPWMNRAWICKLAMAKTYVDLRQPAKALDLLHHLRGSPQVVAWDVARCEAVAYMAGRDYAKAEKVLKDAVQADPNDENR